MSGTTIDVAPVLAQLAPKAASTGSNGYFASGKVAVGNDRYQVTIGSWLVKSKETKKKPTTPVTEVVERLGQLQLVAKEMKGKPGFWAGGKVTTSKGDVLQSSVICTKIA